MAHRSRELFFVVCLSLLAAGCASAAREPAAHREIRAMRTDTLARLFAVEPDSAERIRHAAGFAVFGGPGMRGVVRDNASGADSYTVIDAASRESDSATDDGTRVVFVFTEPIAMHRFRGFDLARATAADPSAERWPGATGVAPGVKLYRLVDPDRVTAAALVPQRN
jgi:hypothetical protein